MQILKPKKERQGDFDNRYIPVRKQKEISLDRIVEQSRANRLAANSQKFDEWKDTDGSVFETYSQLIDYQLDKFIRRYPPNFASSIRPELVIIKDERISWNKEALILLRKGQPESWSDFLNRIEISILKWGGYDYDNEYKNNTDRGDALNYYLDQFAIKLNNLIGENNVEN